MGYNTRQIDLPDRDAAIEWFILHQFGRRNLSAMGRGESAPRLKPIVAAKAEDGVTLPRQVVGHYLRRFILSQWDKLLMISADPCHLVRNRWLSITHCQLATYPQFSRKFSCVGRRSRSNLPFSVPPKARLCRAFRVPIMLNTAGRAAARGRPVRRLARPRVQSAIQADRRYHVPLVTPPDSIRS